MIDRLVDAGIPADRCLSKWVKRDRIDRGEIPETTTTESAELRAPARTSTMARARNSGG